MTITVHYYLYPLPPMWKFPMPVVRIWAGPRCEVANVTRTLQLEPIVRFVCVSDDKILEHDESLHFVYKVNILLISSYF